IAERIGHPRPQRIRHCAVCDRVILHHLQTRYLRRPDIRDKRYVPDQAAAVNAGSDSTDSRRLAGDTDL
ncbi:TPA: hypothetical protein U3W52_005147, partial [Escherichia coli]|nr:hypothetical protein [Escherichia coli]